MKVAQWVWIFATPWTIQSMEFSRSEYWSGWLLPSPEDLSNPGIKPRSPILRADSLSAELQRKPKNTGVGGLSLLQHIFQTQELNWGLLHSRWILYQLSSQGSQKHQWVVVLVAQSCPLLCDLMDCSQPGSCVHGILQARMLEWVAIPFSRGSSWPRDRTWVPSMQTDSLPSELYHPWPREPGSLLSRVKSHS